jgi:L,D-peptidoglycan transpeptidase YkuD (ErfK/YbiS/YcfS/YnhG family)
MANAVPAKVPCAAGRSRPPTVVVTALSQRARRGTARLGGLELTCALGRGGRRALKREGDGATPIGCFQVLGVLYRADRTARPATGLAVKPIRRRDGWCDAPADRNYNRPVRHPYAASAEALWRADRLYDVVVVLGYNVRPRVRGLGSAIFMHVAAPGFPPTEGCIALRAPQLKLLLRRLGRGSSVRVLP